MKSAVTITCAVFVARLPFLLPGYGIDGDAWRTAMAARTIAATHEYWVSRFFGFPLHEMVSALLSPLGAVGLTGGTALMSGLAAGLFWRLAGMNQRSVLSRVALLVAFVFQPGIAVTSVTAQDYQWLLVCVFGATLAALDDRPILAGVLVGCAAGFRATGSVAAIPLVLAWWPLTSRSLKRFVTFAIAAGVMALLAYTPMLAKYGTSLFFFPTPATGNAYASAIDMLRHATVDLWGRTSVAVAALVALAWLVKRQAWCATPTPGATDDRRLDWMWLAFIGVFAGAYLIHAHTWHYLIPTVPFVLLWLQRRLAVIPLAVFAVAVALTTFVDVGRSGFIPGRLLAFQHERVQRVAFVDHVIEMGRRGELGPTVVAGAWLPWIQVRLGRTLADPGVTYFRVSDGSTTYVYLPDAHDASHSVVSFLPGTASLLTEAHTGVIQDGLVRHVDGRAWGLHD
jgi:hypothetical protein